MLRPRFFLCALLAGLLLSGAAAPQAATLAGWNVSGVTGYGPSPLAPTVSDANLTVQGLTRGTGVGVGGTAANRAWGGNNWHIGATIADAISAEKFATFSLSANAGFSLSLSSISRFDYRRSGTGPQSGLLQYRVGAGSFQDVTTLNYSISTSGGASLGAIDLSGIAALQNVAAGTPVTFRVVNYNASGAGGTWYVFDVANNADLDLAIEGSVSGGVTPGVTITQTGSNTEVSEGSAATDTYTLALTTTPAGPVVIEAQAGGQVELSADNATFGSSASVTLNSTTPATIFVRALDDATPESDPHADTLVHLITSTGDPADYPVSLAISSLAVAVRDNDVGPGTVRIRDIQGAAHLSLLTGQTVQRVPGIVTALRSNGFYFQDPAPDANPATSEGIFVFTSSTPTPAVGDSVLVSGVVAEFRPGNDNENLTITEILPSQVQTVSSGNTLPAPTVLGNGGRAIPTQIISDDAAGGNVENAATTFDPENDGIDFYESLEGMLVRVNHAVASGPLNAFGEVPVLADGGANATSRSARGGSLAASASDFNPERIIIDDGLGGTTPSVDVGAIFSTPIVGVIDYSFANYKLLFSSILAVTPSPLTREVTSLQSGPDLLTVATFNVENLDPADGAAKFNLLASLIVNNLRSPDLINLEEMQDNNGAVNDAVVDASVTFQTLINAITAAGGPSYSFTQINPVDDQDGGEPGGNIRVGFLFRADRVGFNHAAGGGPVVATTVVNEGGVPRLSSNPGRIDPANSAFQNSRKPLAGEFMFNGEKLFVIGNHFNSKGGDDPLFGRFQPPVLHSEVQRLQQAQIVRDFVTQILAIDPHANVLVLGDLNDFQFSNPLNLLKSAGLAALVELLPVSERYTYVFDGNSQTLDHILLNSSARIAAPGVEVDVVHFNAEFDAQASDHDPVLARFVVDGTPPSAGVACFRTAAGQILTLIASDAITSSPAIYVEDSVSGFVAGPFASSDRVFVRVVPTQPPFAKPLAGYAARLQFRGPPRVIAVDEAGNESLPAACQ